MKVTIQLDDCDLETLFEWLAEYPELLEKFNEQYRLRYASPTKDEKD